MKHVRITAVAVLSAALTLPGMAQERKIQRSELPPAVQKTMDAEAKGADIKGYATEREHGRKVYEAETIYQGHTRDLQVAADGTLNEVEEEVAFDALPEGVKTALTARAAGAKIVKVESLTRKGKLVAYEAATLKGTHKGEVQVGPEGGKLAHEE